MQLHLLLSGRGLPFAGSSLKVKISPAKDTDEVIKLGKTMLVGGGDPDYSEIFSFEYEEGSSRRITVDVRNEEKVWECSRSFLVEEILSSDRYGVNFEVKNLSSGGVLIAHLSPAEVVGSLKFELAARKLKNQEGLGILRKSDPFFALMRPNDDSDNWDGVYRSVSRKDDLNPRWPEDSIDLVALCDGDLDRPLRIVIFDDNDLKNAVALKIRSEQNEVMGYVETTVAKLLQGGTMPVIRKGKERGELEVLVAELIDYSDPIRKARKVMSALGRAESAKLEAEKAEAAVEDLKKLAAKNRAAAKEAIRIAEEAEAAVEGAEEAAAAAKRLCVELSTIIDDLQLDD